MQILLSMNQSGKIFELSPFLNAYIYSYSKNYAHDFLNEDIRVILSHCINLENEVIFTW
jgi:hypothetical protein